MLWMLLAGFVLGFLTAPIVFWVGLALVQHLGDRQIERGSVRGN